MSILNIIKPKWQHSDPEVRRLAVLALEPSQAIVLRQIILQDSDHEVRASALSIIDDLTFLDSLSQEASACRSEVTAQIAERYNTLLLKKFAESTDLQVAHQLLELIERDALLLEAVMLTTDPGLRHAAVSKMSDQRILAELVTRKCGKITAAQALEKISDRALLKAAAQNASHHRIRATARERLETMEAHSRKISAEQLQQQQRAELLVKARELAADWNVEKASREIKDIETALLDLGLTAESKEQQQFIAAQQSIARKYNEHLRQLAREKAAKQESQRHRERLAAIIQTLEEISLSLAEGTEQRFHELQAEWLHIVSSLPGDIPPGLEEKYHDNARFFIKKRKAINRELRLQKTVRQAIARAEASISAENFDQASLTLDKAFALVEKTAFKFLRAAELTALIDQQRQSVELARNEAEQRAQQLRQENLAHRQSLLAELNRLPDAPDQAAAEIRLKEIEQDLNKAVDLPAGQEALEQELNNSISRFYEHKARVSKEKDWHLWQNKILKEELIARVALLEEEQNLYTVFKEIKEARLCWQEIGPVPHKQSTRLWNRFQSITDHQFQRCQLFFQQKDAEAEANLAQKMVWCRLAEELQESTAWNKAAQALKELQAQWKKTGPTPKGREEQVFSRFRKACDHFFERRSQYYLELERQRQDCLLQKQQICERVEALAREPELSHHQEIKGLQSQWHKIGEVPKNQAEGIWQRFRAGCDHYYSWLESLKPGNQAAQEELCAQAEQLVATLDQQVNFKERARLLKGLQNQWKKTGPVPAEVKEALWQRFRSACDTFFAKQKENLALIDSERAANEALKKELLAQAISLSQEDSKESAWQLISLQERWKKLGLAPKASEQKLQREFQEICNSFFKERREAFEELDALRRQNLKSMEALCLRLEMIAGITPQAQAAKSSGSLTLGEQLKLAFESNFVLAGEQKDQQRRKNDEMKAIQEQWETIGAVPPEHEHAIRKRFQAALQAARKA